MKRTISRARPPKDKRKRTLVILETTAMSICLDKIKIALSRPMVAREEAYAAINAFYSEQEAERQWQEIAKARIEEDRYR